MVTNSKRGSDFEKLVVEEIETYAPNLTVSRIDRSSFLKYESIFDIEFIDFPELRVDCKFTIGQFTFNDLRKLLKTCAVKYCQYDGTPVIIFGERRGKSRLNRDNIGVAEFEGDDLFICPLKEWLVRLNERFSLSQDSLSGSREDGNL